VRAFVQYNSLGTRGWLDRAAPETLAALEVFAGDVRDPHGVRTAMRDCQVVLHLAALIAIPYSYLAPESYVRTNILGTLNVLQAARDLGIKRIVHTSTSEVYGTARFVPITEDHPLQDLLFAMMRSRGVHVLDGFPCFMTTAHGDQEIAAIKKAFRESVVELQESRFLPARRDPAQDTFDAAQPPVPGARLGRDPEGRPAWFVADPQAPGKYQRLR
jgi:hypothetical protein